MGLREEIEKDYLDGYGLVSPAKVAEGTEAASGNGPMYTGEYYLQLSIRRELQSRDWYEFQTKIQRCCIRPGLLARTPNNPDQEGPDDYYGVLAACSVLGMRTLGYSFWHHGRGTWGVFNNHEPGHFSWSAFLWRQPALIYLSQCAAVERTLLTPLWSFLTALSIIYAAFFSKKDDWDQWRITWLLVKGTEKRSSLCFWASEFWFKRLFKAHPGGMREVAKGYYETGHPFGRYWID